MPRLENKTVLISGGASGIGAATARQVVREGRCAVLADRDAEAGRGLAVELGDQAVFTPLKSPTRRAGRPPSPRAWRHSARCMACSTPRASERPATSEPARSRNGGGSTTSTRWALSSAANRRSPQCADRAVVRSSIFPRCSACVAPPMPWPTMRARARCAPSPRMWQSIAPGRNRTSAAIRCIRVTSARR